MTSSPAPVTRRLRHDQFLHFKHPGRLMIRAEQGTLWVTVDGEAADIQLEPGSCRLFKGGAPVTVGVMGNDAVLSVRRLAAPGWRERWQDWRNGRHGGALAA